MAAYSETDSEVNRDQTQTEDKTGPNGPDQGTGSAQDRARAALAAEVDRLSKLSQADYVLERKAAAKALGIGVGDLDKLVAEERAAQAPDNDNAKTTAFTDRTPWPAPVDGIELVVAMREELAQYMIMPVLAIDVVCLWILASYVYDAFDVFPRLAIKAPEPECGKTTLLALIHQLVNRPCGADNATTAALYRMIGKAADNGERAPTILCDEADAWMKRDEEMRGIINSGHRRGAQVLRCVGEENETKAFPVFAAMALAYIGDQAQTIEDRSIKIELKRRMRTEKVASFRARKPGRLPELAAMAAGWAWGHSVALAAADPEMPDEITNRVADNWAPLFAVADLLGGEWPERVRKIALAQRVADEQADPSFALKLLRDIRTVFGNREAMYTKPLIEELWKIEGSPWKEMPRSHKPLTDVELSNLVKKYGIKPGQIKIGGINQRGYRRRDFVETWDRYLPEPI